MAFFTLTRIGCYIIYAVFRVEGDGVSEDIALREM